MGEQKGKEHSPRTPEEQGKDEGMWRAGLGATMLPLPFILLPYAHLFTRERNAHKKKRMRRWPWGKKR